MRLAAMNKSDGELSSRPSVMSARKNQEELKKASLEKQKAMRAQFDESWESFKKRFGEELQIIGSVRNLQQSASRDQS